MLLLLFCDEHICYRQILNALHLLQLTAESHIVAKFTMYSTINRMSALATVQLCSLHTVSVFAHYFNTISINQVPMCPIQIQSLLMYLTLLGDI